MALSKDISTYGDVRKFLDNAMTSGVPLTLTFATDGRAVHFRQRCYTFRALYRKWLTQTYNTDEVQADYDLLILEREGTMVRASKGAPPILEAELEDGSKQRLEFWTGQPEPLEDAAPDKPLELDPSLFGMRNNSNGDV